MAEPFDPSTLSELVLAHVDAQPASIRFIPIRTGKHNTSYWVDSSRGRFVLRVAPPDDGGFLFYERLMMRQEPELHRLIRAHTTLPVAEVVGYDFSRTLVSRDYLIMTALPGIPLSDAAGLTQSRLNRALHQVGEHLRQECRACAEKVYDLIWRRFVASQMAPATYDVTTVNVVATVEGKPPSLFRVSISPSHPRATPKRR